MRWMAILVMSLTCGVAAAQGDEPEEVEEIEAVEEPAADAAEPEAEAEAEAEEEEDDDWGDEEIEEVAEVEEATEESTWFSESYPEFTRGFNIMYARPNRPGAWSFIVQHRTNVPIQKDTFFNYFGFDGGGLKIGLILRYGIIEGLDLGIMRVNNAGDPFDTYELDARYRFLNEKDHFVNMAVRAGITWFSQEDNHASGAIGQILVDKLMFERWLLGLAFMFHSDSSSAFKSNLDTAWSMALGLTTDVRFIGIFGWGFELAVPIAGFKEPNLSFTTGPKIITNRHTFSIVVSNTQYITADGMVAGTFRDFDDLIVGFNITREL